MPDVQQQVREFYDQVGWKMVGDNVYQNAHYEDLRPVSREYIHRCHLRVCQHLPGSGRFLLDAGSGPIQYPEYLEYSKGHQFRVCADISLTALQEAQRRIGDHGLFVVCDISQLPFKAGVFDGVVSLHTIHHLPEVTQPQAYDELYRVLSAKSSAVVVNGWSQSDLVDFFTPLVRLSDRLRSLSNRLSGKKPARRAAARQSAETPKGTFTRHITAQTLKTTVGARMPLEIRVWRSVSVRLLRALIHPWLAGRCWLRLLFWLENRCPHYFGEKGKYPLIVIRKNGPGDAVGAQSN